MNHFSSVIESSILNEYIKKLIENIANLKRYNYIDQIKIIERNREIKEIEEALKELKVDLGGEIEEDKDC